MVHREEFSRETPQFNLVARLDFHQLGVLDFMLGELAFNEAQCELRGVDRHLAVEVLQQVRQRTRVVLVAVRDDDAAQLVGVLKHVRIVGQNKVDTRMIVVGKRCV